MSVERIQTRQNADWTQSGMLETDTTMFEVEQNSDDYKLGYGMPNFPSKKHMRKPKAQMLETAIEKQHQFDLQYQILMRKLELEMLQMKRQLGISPDILNESMPYDLGLNTPSPSFQPAQARRRNATSERIGTYARDQVLESSDDGADYENERLMGGFPVIPDTPDMRPMNILPSDEGDKLTSMSEEVMRDLFDLCDPLDTRDINEDVAWAQSSMAQCVNSYNMPWGEKTIEHQKFKAELFKTEMCRSWAKFGLCPYGENCRFAHGRDELRVRPRPHWKYKTEMCKKFLAGYCPYGSRCSFVHMPIEQHRAMMSVHRSFGAMADSEQMGDMPGLWHRNMIPLDPRKAFQRMLRLNE